MKDEKPLVFFASTNSNKSCKLFVFQPKFSGEIVSHSVAFIGGKYKDELSGIVCVGSSTLSKEQLKASYFQINNLKS